MRQLASFAMPLEFFKLGVGLFIALFHRQIADYIIEQERVLVVLLRQRGVMVPAAVTRNTAYNIYFSLGMFTAAYEIVRIWYLLRG
jgi:hypothetical protein